MAARADTAAQEQRKRGSIRRRGNALQVRVYAGKDAVTGQLQYLTETVPIPPTRTQAARERAERAANAKATKILTALLAQIDAQRNVRTAATLGTLMDTWLRTHDVEDNTRRGYEGYLRRYIRPAIGDVSLGKLTAKVLEDFYAELRRCRLRCDGRPFIEHRAEDDHECRTVRHRWPPGRSSPKNRQDHACERSGCRVIECKPHDCQPLAAQTIRQIHFALSSALSAAVRWDWISSNPAAVAKKPRQPVPQPQPPTPEQASRIMAAAWEQDEAWGTLVWLVMVTGMRRAELCGLRWRHVDLVDGLVHIQRNWVHVAGRGIDKETKTHQIRRVSIDPATVELLAAHRKRYEEQLRGLDTAPPDQADDPAFAFSYQADHGKPCSPSGVTHRYTKMCEKLGIDSHLHALRHYSATELLTAGVDLRTVAGRLGHAGGGATTLRVYAAWVGEADRRAAQILTARTPRPPIRPA